MCEKAPGALSELVSRGEAFVTLTTISEETEKRVLDKAEVVLHIDGVRGVEADLHV
jgi:hypothetical protein